MRIDCTREQKTLILKRTNELINKDILSFANGLADVLKECESGFSNVVCETIMESYADEQNQFDEIESEMLEIDERICADELANDERLKLEKKLNELENQKDELADEIEMKKSVEIFSYHIVSRYLFEKLKAKGALVWEFADLYFWGQTGCGYPLEDESVLNEISADLLGIKY